MWSTPAVCMACILFGIMCDVKQVCSQPKILRRKTEQTPENITKLEEDIQKVINQIHSLSGDNARIFSVPSTGESIDLNAYYGVLSNLYGVFQPMVSEGFLDELPKTLVCILSGRQDCGLEAELTKTVSLELGKPLLMFLSSLRSQTCTPLHTDGGSNSFFRTYLRMGESAAAASSGFQQTVINILSSLSLSESVMGIVSGFMDVITIYVLKFMAALLQVPMDYIRIALQFGITVPSLDEKETCEQGDLKQLIIWGIKHNVSWSFSSSLIDILLEKFLPPEQSPFTHPGPECQRPPSVPFRRSISETKNYTDIKSEALCDRYNLATLNDTLCADILAASGVGSSPSVFTFCQALSSLSPNQIEKMWRNTCYVVQPLVSLLISRSSECGIGDAQPSPANTPLSEDPPLPHTAPHRVAREATNLQQLTCNYNSWLDSSVVDPVHVSLCSDNEPVAFVRQVCNNDFLLRKLLTDKDNSWLDEYCENSSAGPEYMVKQFCVYNQWITQPTASVNSSLLELCLKLDGPRLTKLICVDTYLFMNLFSNPENSHLIPNCSKVSSLPPSHGPLHHPNLLPLESCLYSEWHDVMQITTGVLSHCVRVDQSGFVEMVCSNKTFLNGLLLNSENAWLEEHCNTSLEFPIPEPTTFFDIPGWCDYHTWGERQVDDSVVGLCWQHDQFAFQENVCCKAAVFEKLLQNPQNKWLTSVCTDIKEITVLPEVCKYSEWAHPIIVDMTELALCAESDSLNFTSKVCANDTVLQNLLVNQDNTWLIQHCGNHSNPSLGGGGGQEGGLTGFNPAEQCQYSSWTISPPDVKLLTLCWEQDQTNFVSSVCPNAELLFVMSREPSSMWVSSMCTTYTNYTTTPTNNTTPTDPDTCPGRHLVEKFNWNCSTFIASACQPCTTQNMVLQMIVRCWVENLRSRVEGLLTTPVARVLDNAVSTTLVILLTLEELQSTSWHVTENIRQSVVKSVVEFFSRENNSDKKRILLQCFGTVLSSLLQIGRKMTSDEWLLIREHFNIPLSSLRPVLTAAHNRTVRLILQYYSSNKDTLQLSDKYLSTMVSVLLQTHLAKDVELFPELVPLLVAARPSDIQALPSLQSNTNVRETINENLDSMTLDQRLAFGLWYNKDMRPSSITRGHQSLIRDTGNLIAYLPFQSFQHLSAAQLLDGLDVLQKNTLTSLKQEFIARKLIGTYRNLTAQDFARLGNISCLADPEDLLAYKNSEAFSVIQNNVMKCTQKGISLPSHLVSNLLLNSTELQVPSSLTADRLQELAPLLPSLGVPFLENLTVPQLLNTLPAISSVSFSSEQASIIVDKLSSTTLIPGHLQQLGSLIIGLKAETLLPLNPDTLLSCLTTIAQHTQALCPPNKQGFNLPQANAMATRLWGFRDVVSWLDDVEPLLSCTPLLSILSRTRQLMDNELTPTKPWNTQQAMALFKEVLVTDPSRIDKDFLTLGTLGQGVSCQVLQKRFQADSSLSSVKNILPFLTKQPGLLHTSLKKCVIDKLYGLEFFPELLEDLGVEIALSMPMSTIKKLPTDRMDTLRTMIVENPRHFLLLPRVKQVLLVDKLVQRTYIYTGGYTEEEFRSLGVMASFVEDAVFERVDRRFFTENLDFLRGLCYHSSKMRIVARILQEPAVFGPVQTWNQTTLSQVDRFLFFLPHSKLKEISLALMTVGRIEKLFMNQRQWERGEVGTSCSDENERTELFKTQQFVLQFFLGFLKIDPLSPPPMIPTCEILHTTAPAAWATDSLKNMSTSAFSNCLELIGRDPFLASYQRDTVLRKVKLIYGPVSSFSQSVISQLGGIATELQPEELSALQLTNRRSIAAMGAISTWSNAQLETLFTTVLNSTKQSPSDLDSSTLVAMGYIVCGATPTDMNSFNAVEFSKAVLWLGQLKLSCSEEQLSALVGLLTQNLAFGDMDLWGTDVFIEIGVLAAGLSDFSMSALVKEQIEGITPLAISMIPPKKLKAALRHTQISMFSYEQAVAVTKDQLAHITPVQKTALAVVLTSWDAKPVDFRGRSRGLALSHSPLCLILGLLMLLTVLPCPGT